MNRVGVKTNFLMKEWMNINAFLRLSLIVPIHQVFFFLSVHKVKIWLKKYINVCNMLSHFLFLLRLSVLDYTALSLKYQYSDSAAILQSSCIWFSPMLKRISGMIRKKKKWGYLRKKRHLYRLMRVFNSCCSFSPLLR